MDKECRKLPEGFVDCFEDFESYVAERIANPGKALSGEELRAEFLKLWDEHYAEIEKIMMSIKRGI